MLVRSSACRKRITTTINYCLIAKQPQEKTVNPQKQGSQPSGRQGNSKPGPEGPKPGGQQAINAAVNKIGRQRPIGAMPGSGLLPGQLLSFQVGHRDLLRLVVVGRCRFMADQKMEAA
jgi:hypothetical protein